MQVFNSKAARVVSTIASTLLLLFALIAVSEMYVASKVPTSLPMRFVHVDQWNDGFVIAKGTWTMVGKEHAYPLNTSEVICNRQARECVDASAKAFVLPSGGQAMLGASTESHQIVRWDDALISYETEARCTKYRYSIDRRTKQVSGIRIAKPTPPAGCEGLDAEIQLVLEDGFKVWLQLTSAARPVALNAVIGVLIAGWGVWRVRRVLRTSAPKETA